MLTQHILAYIAALVLLAVCFVLMPCCCCVVGVFSDIHMLSLMYSGEMCYWAWTLAMGGGSPAATTPTTSQLPPPQQLIAGKNVQDIPADSARREHTKVSSGKQRRKKKRSSKMPAVSSTDANPSSTGEGKKVESAGMERTGENVSSGGGKATKVSDEDSPCKVCTASKGSARLKVKGELTAAADSTDNKSPKSDHVAFDSARDLSSVHSETVEPSTPPPPIVRTSSPSSSTSYSPTSDVFNSLSGLSLSSPPLDSAPSPSPSLTSSSPSASSPTARKQQQKDSSPTHQKGPPDCTSDSCVSKNPFHDTENIPDAIKSKTFDLYPVMQHMRGEGEVTHWLHHYEPHKRGLEMLDKYLSMARGPLKHANWDYSRAVQLLIHLKRAAPTEKP